MQRRYRRQKTLAAEDAATAEAAAVYGLAVATEGAAPRYVLTTPRASGGRGHFRRCAGWRRGENAVVPLAYAHSSLASALASRLASAHATTALALGALAPEGGPRLRPTSRRPRRRRGANTTCVPGGFSLRLRYRRCKLSASNTVSAVSPMVSLCDQVDYFLDMISADTG